MSKAIWTLRKNREQYKEWCEEHFGTIKPNRVHRWGYASTLRTELSETGEKVYYDYFWFKRPDDAILFATTWDLTTGG